MFGQLRKLTENCCSPLQSINLFLSPCNYAPACVFETYLFYNSLIFAASFLLFQFNNLTLILFIFHAAVTDVPAVASSQNPNVNPHANSCVNPCVRIVFAIASTSSCFKISIGEFCSFSSSSPSSSRSEID